MIHFESMRSVFPKILFFLFLAMTACSVFTQSSEEFFKDCGYRCSQFESCRLGKEEMACMYGSSNAISGAITFKNGKEFYRELIPEVDVAEPSVKDEGYALINDVRTRYKIFRDNAGESYWRCMEFYKDDSNEVLFAYGNC